jgi:hypothetical protein
MFIDEAVITASRYHDFLRVTLPYTTQQVKKVVVVTSDESFDDPTREVCREFGVKCIRTGLFYHRGARFAKGKAINKGLDQCHRRGWVLTMDADIILPPHSSAHLARLDLDKTALYGIDRVLVPNAAAWKAFVERRVPQYRWSSVVETPPEFPFMARYVHETEGYCPIGFFALRHGGESRQNRDLRYPEDGNEAIHTDVQYALHWDRHKRHLIPEVIAYHLDSCAAPIGANWCGRVTPEFDLDSAKVPTNAGIKSYYDPAFAGSDNPNKSYSP